MSLDDFTAAEIAYARVLCAVAIDAQRQARVERGKTVVDDDFGFDQLTDDQQLGWCAVARHLLPPDVAAGPRGAPFDEPGAFNPGKMVADDAVRFARIPEVAALLSQETIARLADLNRIAGGKEGAA